MRLVKEFDLDGFDHFIFGMFGSIAKVEFVANVILADGFFRTIDTGVDGIAVSEMNFDVSHI